jgi:hypothetical protein
MRAEMSGRTKYICVERRYILSAKTQEEWGCPDATETTSSLLPLPAYPTLATGLSPRNPAHRQIPHVYPHALADISHSFGDGSVKANPDLGGSDPSPLGSPDCQLKYGTKRRIITLLAHYLDSTSGISSCWARVPRSDVILHTSPCSG